MQSPLHSYLAQAHFPDVLPHSEAEEIEVQLHDLVKKKRKKSNACKVKVRFGVPFQSKPSFGVLSILCGGGEMSDASGKIPPLFFS